MSPTHTPTYPSGHTDIVFDGPPDHKSPAFVDADPANLRLLAAAPELYAALARLVDRVEQIELQDGSTPDTLEARALLAKIDGPTACRSCAGSGVKTDKDGIQSDDVCPDCNRETTE